MSFASVTAFAARRGHPSIPPQTPPVFTSTPVIVGTPTVGQTLSYTPGLYTGNPNPSSSQQWTRDGVDISLAAGATYTLVGADATHQVGVRQIATNVLGSASSSSASVTVSGGTVPSFTTSPAILGTPSVGVASSYNQGSVSGFPPPTITQQWTLDGVDIGSATGATYTPVSGNATHLLRVRQIATNTVGSASSTSAAQTVQAATVIGTQTALALSAPTTGTYPYSAAAYMLRGDVPSGYVIDSPDDSTLRSSILSTWDDGSASVVVVAGATALTANAIKMVALRPVTSASGTNLTTAAITSAVTSIAVNFTATYGGTATLNSTSLGSPERIWWANPQVICARYRLAAPSPGSTGLQAVIDIHAYAGGRAFVEVVFENSKVNSASPPASLAGATYTNATVAVNGVTFATVSSPTANMIYSGSYPTGDHEQFRAWYTSGWVGGDPQVAVRPDTAYLQRHPLLFQLDQPTDQDFTRTAQVDGTYVYGTAVYEPWSNEAHRQSRAAAGDHESIGHLAKWDAQFLQSGDVSCRKAVIANALANLSYPISYRDTTTKLVPTLDQTYGWNANAGTWPAAPGGSGGNLPSWEGEHTPSIALMAFVCQPSPVFIEIAQKAALVNFIFTADGTFNKYWAGRNVAWSFRNLAHAIFLTPDALPWKSAAVSCLGRNADKFELFRTSPPRANPLGVFHPGAPDEAWDEETGYGLPGCQASIWMHSWMAFQFHRIDKARLLSGTAATKWANFTDWLLAMPVRIVNESTAGEWRFHGIETTIGANDASADATDFDPGFYSTWGAAFLAYRGTPPSLSGPWQGINGHPAPRDYLVANNPINTAGSGALYTSHFWGGLTAAVERGVTGASTAWSTVLANITNLTTYRRGFASDPRQGAWPRTLSGSNYVNPKWPAWRRSMLPGTWKKVGGVPNDVNPLNSAALNPLGAGVTGTWQNIPPGSMNLDTGTAGSEGFTAVTDDWCGGTYYNGRLYIWGGGHNGYGGNEVMSIGLADAAPAYRLERPPTGAIGYGQGAVLADQQESTHMYADGNPRSAHTYDLMAWASNGKMYAISTACFRVPEGRENTTAQKLWAFTPHASPGTGYGNGNYGTWAHVATFPAASVGINWNSCTLFYDEVRNSICVFSHSYLWSWSISTGTWSSAVGMTATDGEMRTVRVPYLDLNVFFNYYSSGRFMVHKPSTNASAVPTATGTAPDSGSGNAEFYTSANWVPELGAIVSRAEGGTGFHLLTPPASGDPMSTPWAWSRLEASAANTVTPDANNANGDYGRFFYSPELRCLGLVASTTGQLNIFALP